MKTKVHPQKDTLQQGTKVKLCTNVKKKNRRSSDPLNSLKKEFTLKSRAEQLDFDYLHKLSQEEKLWLAQFAKEEIHAAVSKNPRKNKFNRTRAEVKAIYGKNNANQRCTLTREKAKGMTEYLEDHKDTLLSNNPEAWVAVKMDLEKDGWVDINGDIVKTEEEVIAQYKLEEKMKKTESRKKK